MSKAILYTAVSLDGLIASKEGGIEFLDHPRYQLPEEDYGYEAFYSMIDVVVMGYNTYAKILSFEGEYPYQGVENVVLSTKEGDIELINEDIHVESRPVCEVVRDLKAAGKTIWIVGGGATNAALHEGGLIDEMFLTYVPTTLGEGIPLFRSNAGSYMWHTEGVRSYPNGLVQVHLSKS